MKTNKNLKSSLCHILIMTYRVSDNAFDIIKAAVDFCKSVELVTCSICYGGSDSKAMRKYLQLVSNTNSINSSTVECIFEADFYLRLKMGLNHSAKWTIFLSDDDPFSVNYLPVLLKDASNNINTNQVGLIGATLYPGHNNDSPIIRKLRNITSNNINIRISELCSQRAIWSILFYSMHRTTTVLKWQSFLHQKSFKPSYLDQILVFFSICEGNAVSSSELTSFTRDEDNWTSLDLCIINDAKSYPDISMVLFHELFWLNDIIMICKMRDIDITCIYNFAFERLTSLVNNLSRKIELLSISPKPIHYKLFAEIENTWLPSISNNNTQNLNLISNEIINISDLITSNYGDT